MGKETVAAQPKVKITYACPQCSTVLPDYSPTCTSCALDLIRNETRSTEQLAKSVNKKEQSVFFYVSPVKLIVMSFVTYGLYDLVWFYKNWTYAAEHTSRKMFPAISTLFGVITFYGLMKETAAAGREQNIVCKLPLAWIAIGYFVLNMCARREGPVMLLGMLSPLMLLPVQLYINKLNSNSITPINSKFSVLNWVFIVIGAVWNFLILLSIFVPEPK